MTKPFGTLFAFRFSFALLAVVTPLAFLAAATVPAGAQGRGAEIKDLQPSGDFLLTIDGTEIPKAAIYRSERNPAILIRTSRLDEPVLLIPGNGSVSGVHIMKMSMRPDGGIDLLPGAALRSYGRFNVRGEEVVFSVDGKELTLKPMPPLLGHRRAADLKKYSSLYVRGASAYTPDQGSLNNIKAAANPVKVKVYFGSWCPHCQRTVPGAVRVAEELAGSKVEFDFIGLPRGFSGNEDAKRDKVTAVPTGIVYVGGKEVGRIEGDSWGALEKVLSRLVAGTSG